MTDDPPDGAESGDSGKDDIPLNIAGHEDREPPSGSDMSNGESGANREQSDPRDRERPDGGTELFGDDGGSDSSPEPDAAPDEPEMPDTEDEEPAADADEDEDEEVVEPVEVLVGLAEDGEIDPWDIDIVAVTDKFLDRLDEGDLRTSGRALFYASVLLRMKGDAMLDEGQDEEEEPWDEPWEQAMDGEAPDEGPDPFAALETEMDRRLDRKRARGMPETLDELVRDLRSAERDNWWKESREYDTSDSPDGFQRGTQELDYRSGDDLRMDDEPTAEDVTGTAHAENIDEVIADVYDAVREQYDKGRDEVLYKEVEEAAGSRVQTFLGLLFLSHRGQVRLQQDDLFGDLWIQDPNAAIGSEEAVAD